jgi:hypothetical protein
MPITLIVFVLNVTIPANGYYYLIARCAGENLSVSEIGLATTVQQPFRLEYYFICCPRKYCLA